MISLPFGTPWTEAKRLLLHYFRSGWVFLIPYLVAYLLYAWMRWPVNLAAGGEGVVKGISESGTAVGCQWSVVPPLLHVYWFLHSLHLLLGGLALHTWWRSFAADQTSASTLSRSDPELVEWASPVSRAAFAALPWLCLALLFWIPGVYLEWPSDPWEHLRRINEWQVVDNVVAHSSWMKSSYFIPYSLLSWAKGLRQLFWLDFYYTGICLLLCWQYYRFALACRLGKRTSLIFVILQALLLGNNIFSFYRYYGISSSIYAQLGAVALTRLAIEAARGSMEQGVKENGRPPCSSLSPPPHTFLLQGASALALVTLIAFNHPQGLGIAGLGIAAVAVWRVIEWKRSALWWLIGGTITANALFLWLYPRSALIETYRASGWLNAWYGFNILNFTSPAGDRMLQIVSFFGLVNLAAAFFLFRRNHVAAWLTILPLGMLLLPSVAVPLTQILTRHGGADNIITVQRMLFSIPPSLALACLLAQLRYGWETVRSGLIHKTLSATAPSDFSTEAARILQPSLNHGSFVFVCLVLIALMVVPSSSPSFNRIWNASASIPNDLQLRDIFSQYEAIKPRLLGNQVSKIITIKAGTALRSSYSFDLIGAGQFRMIGIPATDSITAALDFLGFDAKNETARPSFPAKASQKPSTVERLNLLTDSKAGDPAAWITLGGAPPEFVSAITDLPTTFTAMQNPTGAQSNPFTSAMIPIERLKTYRLEMTVKQALNTRATVYLAVVWYDASNGLLESNLAQPKGAGNPRGWANGTYSYFGLVSQIPSTSWTTYGLSFGLNEVAAIPANARYARVGALLNHNNAPSAVVQLTNVRLFENTTPAIDIAIPKATSVYSPASQAAQLSIHWPPQQVMLDRGGTKEILAAALPVAPTTPAESRIIE